MQRDLSDLTKEQSDLFLDQFHGALRRRTGLLFEGEGSAGFRDGIFESELTGPMETQAGVRILVTWRLRQLPDGRLISIEATGSDSGQEIEIQAFVGDVLTAVLSNKSREFAIRRFFRAVHHANLNGEYWIGGFRFAPLYPDDASSLINADRMLVVDQKVEAVDQAHANEMADERAGLAGAQLTLLTGVGL